jgi:3-hydroxymyristoyl/3-hydroxydecanoyl-(acyl carrier protein) dehydratase
MDALRMAKKAINYNDLMERLPQGSPHAFIDAVLDYDMDKMSHAVTTFSGADGRLVDMPNSQRLLPLGSALEAALQGLLLGRALGLDRKHAFIVKKLRARCTGLPHAGDRVDIHGKGLRSSPQWGISESRLRTAEELLVAMRVTWIMLDLNVSDVFAVDVHVPALAEDRWVRSNIRHDFRAIQQMLRLTDPRAIHLDMIGDLDAPHRIVAGRRVSSGLPLFQGHFPERAVLPGTLQIESAWQALCILHNAPLTVPSSATPLDIDLRLETPMVPGDTLTLEINMATADHAVVSCFNAVGKRTGRIDFKGLEAIFPRRS